MINSISSCCFNTRLIITASKVVLPAKTCWCSCRCFLVLFCFVSYICWWLFIMFVVHVLLVQLVVYFKSQLYKVWETDSFGVHYFSSLSRSLVIDQRNTCQVSKTSTSTTTVIECDIWWHLIWITYSRNGKCKFSIHLQFFKSILYPCIYYLSMKEEQVWQPQWWLGNVTDTVGTSRHKSRSRNNVSGNREILGSHEVNYMNILGFCYWIPCSLVNG